MNNLQKRIITSLITFPFVMYFIIKGGNYIVSLLYSVLILANFEAFSVFKRKFSIIFLDVVLVISLLSILHLRNDTVSSYVLLIKALFSSMDKIVDLTSGQHVIVNCSISYYSGMRMELNNCSIEEIF